MQEKRVRELSAELIRDLDLDKSATTEAVCIRLCEVMSQRTRQPVILRFDDLGDSGVSGLWAVTEEGVNVVLVATVRSWMHRLLILLHEVAHMLCGHKPTQLDTAEGKHRMFPDLPSEMLTVLAARTVMREAEECEADRVAGALARELIEWANQQRVSLVCQEGGQAAVRLGYTLGFSVEGGRDE
ncbi:hypothetical protein [Amycolatopsis sp. NPDC049868]|uniref:hypothetical protein n=1 Tax=Amycolatopsis sp. NPDC049868 TaxID=3363934 RepID=UPI00378ECC89